MSVFHNLYARSEQWRLEWGCRTCISAAVVSFLLLFGPTKDYLTRYGTVSRSFAAVIAIFVKDQTLGQTLTNAWCSILGAFIGTFPCWILFLIFRQYYEDYVPLSLLLATELVFVFILQYLEMLPVVKKIAVCLTAINLIGNRHETNPAFYLWGLFLAVCIGSACAIVGCIVPLPVRLAGTELKERIHYYSESMSSLIKDLTISWMNMHKPRSPFFVHTRNLQEGSMNRLRCLSSGSGSAVHSSPVRNLRKHYLVEPEVVVHRDQVDHEDSKPAVINKHWRKLRLAIITVAVFKQTGKSSNCTHFHPVALSSKREFNTRFIRLELVNYLRECLPYLVARNTEAKFGPSRRLAIRCAKFVKLLQDALLIITRLETHIENMEKMHKYHYIYETFFARPNLQYGLVLYAQCLGNAIQSISTVLQVQSSFHDDLLHPSVESYQAVEAAAKLLRARTYFDAEYLKARKDIFYPERGVSVDHNSGVNKVADRPPPVREKESTLVPPPLFPSSPSSPSSPPRQRIESMYSDDIETPPSPQRKHINRNTTSDTANKLPKVGTLQHVSLKIYGKAMLDVNSVIFLLDTLSRLLVEFWDTDELVKMAQSDALNPSQQSYSLAPSGNGSEHNKLNVRNSNDSTSDSYSESSDINGGDVGDSLMLCEEPPRSAECNAVHKFGYGFLKFVYELFPLRQSHLLCISVSPSWQFKFELTRAIRLRLASSLTVAVAMTIAAFYGIINRRPQASLASFTIAFLAGGAVSGINVMTCINRAVGKIIDFYFNGLIFPIILILLWYNYITLLACSYGLH